MEGRWYTTCSGCDGYGEILEDDSSRVCPDCKGEGTMAVEMTSTSIPSGPWTVVDHKLDEMSDTVYLPFIQVKD